MGQPRWPRLFLHRRAAHGGTDRRWEASDAVSENRRPGANRDAGCNRRLDLRRDRSGRRIEHSLGAHHPNPPPEGRGDESTVGWCALGEKALSLQGESWVGIVSAYWFGERFMVLMGPRDWPDI